MSGITGIFRRDGRDVDPADIKKMNDKISHRGPDGSKIWCEGPVAFGHQMLHTTQESLHEILPFEDEESGLVITADARIDNRKDLAPQLGIEDNEYVSDSYFILKAYEKWGEKCPKELLGDFAFAIWDKNKEKLFCARDHMGVKPFYYCSSKEILVFASEIKSIFSIIGTDKRLNYQMTAYSLGLVEGDEREFTIYDKVTRLPAANILLSDFRKIIKNTYWSLDPDSRIQFNSKSEYESAFLNLFKDAVNIRLRSSFQVGSMISGGLDSSLVSCIAQNIYQTKYKKKLKTFSAYFDSVPESNERYFVEKILSCNDFDHHFIKADEISPIEEILIFFSSTDQPFIAPNTFMIWNIIRQADLNGVKILLDGFEGDATISHGNLHMMDLFYSKHFKKLYFELINSKKHGKSLIQIIRGMIFNLLPLFLRLKLISFKELKGNGIHNKIIMEDFAKRNDLMIKIMDLYTKKFGARTAHEYHYLILTSGLLQSELELLDALSAYFGIELRHPFFDKRLIEFCYAIPTELKIFRGWDRIILRNAMSGILPKEVQWRKKKGNLSFNFKQKLMQEQNIFNEIIFERYDLINDFIDIEKIHEIYNQCKKGNTKDTFYLWRTLIFYLWLKESK